MSARPCQSSARPDDGFALVALIVAIFLILLALSVAAPRVAMQLKHDREIETAHRAHQYTRAIQLYYKKLGHYPANMDQLEKSNNIRFLRQRYADPFTGEANWRLIHVGENKTTVKGFFGQDLPGIAPGLGAASGMGSGAANLGSAASSASTTGGFGSTSNSTSAFSGSSSSSFGSSSGSSFGGSSTSSFGSSSPTTTSSSTGSSFGTGSSVGSGTSGSTGSTGSSGFGTGVSSQSAPSATGTGGGAFMGIGTVHTGAAMLTVNEQTDYQNWEFLYDPRVETLKAQVSIFGGGGPPTGGSTNGIGGSVPGTNDFGTNPGTNGFGTSTPGFGNSTGSAGSTFGSSPTAPTGTGTTTPTTTPPN